MSSLVKFTNAKSISAVPRVISSASNLWLIDNGQSLLAPPEAARRIRVLSYRLRLILYAVPSFTRRDEMPVFRLARGV